MISVRMIFWPEQDYLGTLVTELGKKFSRHFSYECSSGRIVGSSRVDLQACKLEYSIVSPK